MQPTLNHGGQWTSEEEITLLQELASDSSIETIAEAHKRTVGAIRARQNHIARRLVLEEGCTVEIAARRVRTHPSSVQKSLDASKKSLANAQERRNAGVKKEETLLSVMVDVRELLRQMLANQTKLMQSID